MLGKLFFKKEFINKNYFYLKKRKFSIKHDDIKIIGITRIRNEELIIEDTLKHMSNIVDAIIILDDYSTDSTLKIIKKNKKVAEILCNKYWEKDRTAQETQHRKLLLDEAKKFNPEWIFYFDADERFEIDKDKILKLPQNIDGIRIKLFDAYITASDNIPYTNTNTNTLMNFRKYFGPERRDILMIFRNEKYIEFKGLDAREPIGCKNEITEFYCQHYGKAISEEQWEETCDYYAKNFPEPYKSKWKNRKGKSIHTLSDFQSTLYTWEVVKKEYKRIHP
jgi:hypothetical protein